MTTLEAASIVAHVFTRYHPLLMVSWKALVCWEPVASMMRMSRSFGISRDSVAAALGRGHWMVIVLCIVSSTPRVISVMTRFVAGLADAWTGGSLPTEKSSPSILYVFDIKRV